MKSIRNENDCYQNLANAIVAQAASDIKETYFKKYTSKEKQNKLERMKIDCITFFRSEWFKTLTKVNPTYILNKIDKNMKELEKEIDTLLFTNKGYNELSSNFNTMMSDEKSKEKGARKYYFIQLKSKDYKKFISVIFYSRDDMVFKNDICLDFSRKFSDEDYDICKIIKLYENLEDEYFVTKARRITKVDYDRCVLKHQDEIRELKYDRIIGYFIPKTYNNNLRR